MPGIVAPVTLTGITADHERRLKRRVAAGSAPSSGGMVADNWVQYTSNGGFNLATAGSIPWTGGRSVITGDDSWDATDLVANNDLIVIGVDCLLSITFDIQTSRTTFPGQEVTVELFNTNVNRFAFGDWTPLGPSWYARATATWPCWAGETLMIAPIVKAGAATTTVTAGYMHLARVL